MQFFTNFVIKISNPYTVTDITNMLYFIKYNSVKFLLFLNKYPENGLQTIRLPYLIVLYHLLIKYLIKNN